MPESHKRSLPSTALAEARIERLQHRVLLVRCCPGALSQYAAKPLIAGIGTTSLANTSAFVIAGAETGPGCQVGIGWKLFHVWTDFGKNRGGSLCFDARYCLQQSMRFLELFGAEPRPDLTVQGFYLHLKEIVVAKSVPQEKTVMFGETMPLQTLLSNPGSSSLPCAAKTERSHPLA